MFMPKASRPLVAPGYVPRAEPLNAASAASAHAAATAVMPRAFFMSSLLLLSMPSMAADPPGDLHVGFVGRDRETAVLELRRDPCARRRLEIAQLVCERWHQGVGRARQPNRCEAAAIRPHLPVVGHVARVLWCRRRSHCDQRGRPR